MPLGPEPQFAADLLDDPATGVVGAGIIGVLLAIFRLMFSGLRYKDREVTRHVRRLTWNVQRSEQREAWERQRGDHWMAVALNAQDVPPHPPPWVEPEQPDDLDEQDKESRWTRK